MMQCFKNLYKCYFRVKKACIDTLMVHLSIPIRLFHNEVRSIVNFHLKSVHSQSLMIAEVLSSFYMLSECNW